MNVIDTIRLVTDPETRTAGANNTQVTSFRAARNQRPVQGVEQPPIWLNVTAFGQTGTFAANNLHKGQEVLVNGTFSIREYQAKDGTTKPSYDITALTLQFVGARQQDSDATSTPARTTKAASKATPVSNNDLPF